jgi:hypothetical protein
LIFVSRPKLPVPLFSYRLFELKSKPSTVSSTVSFWAAGVLRKDSAKTIQFKTFRC